jgi:predicted transcriptional regulator
MKQLSEELYPEKKYNDVRSMMSDYINLLSEYGLVKKIRRGRQIFLSITEKGIAFFDKNKRKKLLKVLNKQ